MTTLTAGGSMGGRAVAVLIVLACMAGASAAVWGVLRYFDIGLSLASLTLAALLVVIGIVLINVVLIAVDNWLDRTQGGDQ